MDALNSEKQKQATMIAWFAFMIIVISAIAAFYPILSNTTGEINIEYLLLGTIVSFLIFIFFKKHLQIRCKSCKKFIPSDSNLCLYCGIKLK